MFLIKSPSNNSINNRGICKNPDDNIEVSMTTIFQKCSDPNFTRGTKQRLIRDRQKFYKIYNSSYKFKF